MPVIYKVWAKVEIEKIDYDKNIYETVEEMPMPVPLGVFDSLKKAIAFAQLFDDENCIDPIDEMMLT